MAYVLRVMVGALAAAALGACSTSSDPCAGINCSSRGFCIEDQGTPYCACLHGYHPSGLGCVVNDGEDPCLGVECSGHGACRSDDAEVWCDCDLGYRPLLPGEVDCAEVDCDLLCLPRPPPDGGLEADESSGDDGEAVDSPDVGDADDVGEDDGLEEAADAADDGSGDVPAPQCRNGTVEPGEECDDGNAAPLDGCEPDCRFTCHAADECADDDPCTEDLCEAAGGGRLCRNPAATGVACDDGNPCTSGETCDAGGACTGGVGACDCATTADCAPHEDGDRCNGTLVCETGTHTCVVDPATLVTCDTGRDTLCRRNRCTPATGACLMTDEPDGTVCDDDRFCTLTDACRAGVCTGSGSPCASGSCALPCDETVDRCPFASGESVCRAPAGPCDLE